MLVEKEEFVFPAGVWLNWAQTAPAFRDGSPFAEYCAYRTMGREKAQYFARLDEDVRARVARLFDATSQEVFFGANTTSVLNTIIDAMLEKHPDLAVVGSRQAYPTLALAGQKARRRIWVGATDQAYINAIRAAEGPTLVLLESQEYRSGERYDIVRLQDAAREQGEQVRLLLDASQWPESTTKADRSTMIAFSGAKWAGGPNGVAVGIVPQAIWDTPRQVGWASLQAGWTLPMTEDPTLKDSASRIDAGGGGKPWLSIALLNQGLQLIERLGRSDIERHVIDRANELREGLTRIGIAPLGGRRPGGNVCFDADTAFAARIGDAGVICTYALGRVRLAPGPWTTSQDTRLALEAIDACR